ncbi:flagellin [Bacillus infantis]|uniref:flagellin N-terminal helical domain-containing protein n=1 Tax=Bacillus infantis TaxID=324767 RepID=UPI00344D23B8
MRINHNIAALNTYRQLNSASTAQGKSMEKLSSGLRINKAGDDAAGLAISEKMRGQIRGLDQASRNSQDAISMVQTAEGALSETHDILQRMRELAVQASNDTNTADDREEIQKEVNQLTSEINRIGNTTEFNTKKLLNGSVSSTGAERQVKAGATGTLASAVTIEGNASLDTGKYKVEIQNNGGTANKYQNISGVSDLTTSTAPLSVSATSADNNSDVNLAEGNYKVVIQSQTAKSASGTTSSGDDVLNVAGGNSAVTVDANSNLSGSKSITVAKVVEKTATAVTGGGISNVDADTAKEGAYEIKTSAVVAGGGTTAIENATTGAISNIQIATNSTLNNTDGYTIKVTQTESDEADGSISFSFELQKGGAAQTPPVIATTSVSNNAGSTKISLGDISFDLDNAKMWASDTTGDNTAGSFDGNTVALTIQNKVEVRQINTGETQSVTIADNNAGGTQSFTFTGAEAGTLKLDVTDTANALVRGNTFTTNVTDTDKYTIQLSGQTAPATVLTENQLTSANLTNISLGDAGNGVNLDLDSAKLNAMAAGSTSTISFNVTSGTNLTASLQNMDGSAVAGSGSIALTGTTSSSLADLGNGVKLSYDGTNPNTTVKAGEVVVSVKDVIPADDFQAVLKKSTDGGSTYGTTVETKSFTKGDAVDFTNGLNIQTATGTTTTDSATFEIENGVVDKSLTMQVGANAGQTFAINMNDMRADALDISNTTASATKTVQDSLGNNIQASYRATTNGKEVTNGTDNTGTEYALDVTDAEKATAAVKVLDEAIQTVSQERSKFGAYQNRLEHTINNLNTSSENLTAAESRIRDVDMAKEMMTQTKNSILSQAAQAMLAQANQQPQGVLQLLR